jgi:hypothetical protein
MTDPLVAPAGTVTTIDVEFQLVDAADVPLNLTALAPWVDPKFVPVMVTDEPMGPAVVDKLAILGTWYTVNGVPLLGVPFTVTTTFPDVAPLGTGTVMLVAVQFVGVAAVPLNIIVLPPCGDPKFTPVIATEVPAGPAIGDMPLIVGVVETVKGTALLEIPFTTTTRLPDVAAIGTGTEILVAVQFVGDAATPLNVTVLVPWVDPKLVPAIVTGAPGTAVVGETAPISGSGICPLNVLLTLSKVAVSRVDVLPLASTSPTSTFVVMVIVCVDPNWVQFTPSGDW